MACDVNNAPWVVCPVPVQRQGSFGDTRVRHPAGGGNDLGAILSQERREWQHTIGQLLIAVTNFCFEIGQ